MFEFSQAEAFSILVGKIYLKIKHFTLRDFSKTHAFAEAPLPLIIPPAPPHMGLIAMTLSGKSHTIISGLYIVPGPQFFATNL